MESAEANVEGSGSEDADPFSQELLPWMPVTNRAWLVQPLVFIAIAVGVIVVTVNYATDRSLSPTSFSWFASMTAVILGSLVVAASGRRAYARVTERSAAEYRRVFWVTTCAVIAVTIVSGAITGNGFLASTSTYMALPLLNRARHSILNAGRARLHRSRLIVAGALAASIAVCLISGIVVLNAPTTPAFQQTYATIATFYLGLITLVGTVLTLIQLKPARYKPDPD